MVELTIEDLERDPHKFGLPTFEEFSKNPEKWRKVPDELFALVDVGSTNGLKNLVVAHEYEVSGYKCKTLEEVERVALNEGMDIKMMDIKPEVIPLGGGKCNILVRFVARKPTTEEMIQDAIKNL